MPALCIIKQWADPTTMTHSDNLTKLLNLGWVSLIQFHVNLLI